MLSLVARLLETLEPRNTYIFHVDDLPQRPPSKKTKSEKIPIKGHPRARTLAEFKETFPDTDKRRNPLVQTHAPVAKHRYPCIQLAGGVLTEETLIQASGASAGWQNHATAWSVCNL